MRRLLITGAGRAAMACIEQLSKLKHQFSITVLRGPASMPDTNTGAGEQWDQQRLDKLGVEVRPGVCVEAIDRYAKVVRACDGSRTTFDTLILAAESANPALARAAGLEVRSGVLLNDFLQTSDAHVYALGDGAEHRGTVYSDSESIDRQAKVLAAHVAGQGPAAFQGNPTADAATSGIRNLSAAIRTCAVLPASSAGSARRSEAQMPEPEGQTALAGAA
jgi:NAD(P)H-nitrite reductase large subunit